MMAVGPKQVKISMDEMEELLETAMVAEPYNRHCGDHSFCLLTSV